MAHAITEAGKSWCAGLAATVETQEELMSLAVKPDSCRPPGSLFLGEAQPHRGAAGLPSSKFTRLNTGLQDIVGHKIWAPCSSQVEQMN